jgi:sortase (surface protein transpeptidase)
VRRLPLVSAVLGALLVLGAPVVWLATQPADAVGELDALLELEATDDASAPEEPVEPAAAPPVTPPPAVETTGSSFTTTELSGPLSHVAVPSRIRIPSLGVDAAVVPVGLEDDGTMEIPHDVRTVGWFEPGIRPGEDGSAVLSGHVDSRTQGAGAFFELRSLDVDDEVVVTAGSTEQRWRVVARDRYGKDELPVDALFARDGDPRLVLITCGGEFDATSRSYADNVVVVAVPA